KAAGESYPGRKPSFTRTQFDTARSMIASGKGVSAIATDTGLSRQTIYRLRDDPLAAEAARRKARVRPSRPRLPRDGSFERQGRSHFHEPGEYEVWLRSGGHPGNESAGGFFVAPLGQRDLAIHGAYASVRPGTHHQRGMASVSVAATISLPSRGTARFRTPDEYVVEFLANNAAKLFAAEANDGRIPDTGHEVKNWDWW